MFIELQKSLLVSFEGCWTQWQRFESSSIHHFWDTCQHFLKTHFCLESWFFLLCLELQIILILVSFEGCWTQWQRFESSSIHHFWDTYQHFLKTHFCLESGFLSFLELQISLLVSFEGCWTQWQRFESSSIHHFWDTCQHFLKTHFCLESGFLSFLVPEQRCLAYHYTQLGRWTYFGWTQWQRFESSSTHHFWDTPQHFFKTHFCLESGFLSFLVPEQRGFCILNYNGKGLAALSLLWRRTPAWYTHCCRDAFLHSSITHNLEDEPTLAEHNGKGLKALAFTISEIPCQHFLKTHLCLESGFLLFIELH